MTEAKNTKYVEEHLWAHDLYGQLIGFEIVDFYMEETGSDCDMYDTLADAWPTLLSRIKRTRNV